MKKAVPNVFKTDGIEGVVVHPLIIEIKNYLGRNFKRNKY